MRSRWGAALRIARRDALRHRGRSLLVMLMVGVPVMLAVGLATVISTVDVDGREALDRTVGSAQAYVTSDGFGVPMVQSADGRQAVGDDPYPADPTVTPEQARRDLERRTDARLVPVMTGSAEAVGAARDGTTAYVSVVAADLADPAARGLVELDRGRLPRADDEVVVTPALARTGHEPGRTIDLGGVSLRVVGVGTTGPRTVAESGAVVTPAAFAGVATTDPSFETTGFLVDRAAPVTWEQVQSLNRAGYVVTSRAVLLDPPEGADSLAGGTGGVERTVLGLVVACIVIEVALLAGPAFAVGARSQRRHLALVAAGGGSPADLRRIVMAGALGLGGIAAAVGAVLGVALTPLALAASTRFVDTVRGPLDVPWGWAVLAVLLGVVAAVVAAVVPARQAARRDLVAALTERPDDPRPAAGWPVLGGAMVVAGLVLVDGRVLGSSDPTLVVAFGTVVLVVGVVFLVPLLIGGVGRLASHLPLAPRIAVRDTARQRARSAPAVAAVMAVVAGITALAIASASQLEQEARDYVYTAPDGQATIGLAGADGAALGLDSFVAEARQEVPDHRLVQVRPASDDGSEGVYSDWRTQATRCSADAPGCADAYVSSSGEYASYGVIVADADDLAALGVRLDGAARTALESGTVLAVSPGLVEDGRTALVETRSDERGNVVGTRREEVAATVADLAVSVDVPPGNRTALAEAVVPVDVARRLGIAAVTGSVVTDVRDGRLSQADVAALGSLRVEGRPAAESMTVERGFTQTFTIQFLALGVAGGLLVLIGTLTATGLALSDARSDLATLSAVGAAPRTRRAVAASQALVVGVLGTALGVVVGAVPGWVAATALTGGDDVAGAGAHVVPWDLLALVVVGVPLLAAVVAGLAVRGRAVMVRRVA